MALLDILSRLRIPVISAPLFIVSNPKLVIAQCRAGVVGSFPALNARPQSQLDEWLHEITEALSDHDRDHPDRPSAPFAVNQIVHRSNDRFEADMTTCAKWKVPIVITSLGARPELNDAVHGWGGITLHDIIDDRYARKAIEGWRVAFATNNATKSTSQYVDKLKDFGIQARTNQIVTTASTTGHYLKTIFPTGGSVYVIGEGGLLTTLEEFGFYHSEDNPLAVISSLDRNLTYEKLRIATRLINAGKLFIATNPDRALPTPEGLIPGAGSILALWKRQQVKKPR